MMDRFEEQEIKSYLKRHLKLETIYKNNGPYGHAKAYMVMTIDGESLGEIPLEFW